MKKVHIKNHINNSMAESLYRYGYQYDSLETDIYLDFMINKNEKKIILLNTKLFSFISQINVEFENDYDNEVYFNILPDEINKIISKNLITSNSIHFDLLNLHKTYNLKSKLNYSDKNIINYCLKFELKKQYLNKLKDNKKEYFNEFIHKIPIYLMKKNEYGLIISSKVNRKLKITVTYMNYNNQEFYEYKEKYINDMLQIK